MIMQTIEGSEEIVGLVAKLWPWEEARVREMLISDLRIWLNEHTGLYIMASAELHFNHWLPCLREMLAEKTA